MRRRMWLLCNLLRYFCKRNIFPNQVGGCFLVYLSTLKIQKMYVLIRGNTKNVCSNQAERCFFSLFG